LDPGDIREWQARAGTASRKITPPTGSVTALSCRRTRDLVGALLILLQQGRLKIQGSLRHAATLEQELTNFRVKISTRTAHDSCNAREGEHDDLLLAAALGCWQAARRNRSAGDYPVVQR